MNNYVLFDVFMFAAKVVNNAEVSKGSLVFLSCKECMDTCKGLFFDITWITNNEVVTNDSNYTIITVNGTKLIQHGGSFPTAGIILST